VEREFYKKGKNRRKIDRYRKSSKESTARRMEDNGIITAGVWVIGFRENIKWEAYFTEK